jgi:hypothetical protein
VIDQYVFILWLAFRDALTTWEKMCGWEYSGGSLCLFCRAMQENVVLAREFGGLLCQINCRMIDPPVNFLGFNCSLEYEEYERK